MCRPPNIVFDDLMHCGRTYKDAITKPLVWQLFEEFATRALNIKPIRVVTVNEYNIVTSSE